MVIYIASEEQRKTEKTCSKATLHSLSKGVNDYFSGQNLALEKGTYFSLAKV